MKQSKIFAGEIPALSADQEGMLRGGFASVGVLGASGKNVECKNYCDPGNSGDNTGCTNYCGTACPTTTNSGGSKGSSSRSSSSHGVAGAFGSFGLF